MEISKNFSEFISAVTKKIELHNRQNQQALRCQVCTTPVFCVQYVILPVFSTFFSRQFIEEELFYECRHCLFRVALPQPLSEQDSYLLQRRLERKIAKEQGVGFADVVHKKLVKVTNEYILIRM